MLASSSAGTQAGLEVGAKKNAWPGRILGISIDHPAEELGKKVAYLAGETADRLGLSLTFNAGEVLVNDSYLGGGYGVLGTGEIEAIRLFAQTEGLLLDPVYTARAASGMIDLIRQGFFSTRERVLFWHTGGTPALLAPAYMQEF